MEAHTAHEHEHENYKQKVACMPCEERSEKYTRAVPNPAASSSTRGWYSSNFRRSWAALTGMRF
jgi:hypothetical protein